MYMKINTVRRFICPVLETTNVGKTTGHVFGVVMKLFCDANSANYRCIHALSFISEMLQTKVQSLRRSV